MAKDVLLEIGLEEMPAHIVSPSRIQLEKKVKKFIEENRLTYETIESFSTPRRLAIRVTQLAERQEDISEEVKGPAKKIALDEVGQWSKAAQGFVRGQGVSTDAITFKELNGVEYVYITKHVKGNDSLEVLKGLQEVIMSLNFPVTMHWGNYHFEYIRPIHWIVALFDETVIPFSVLDVQTSNTSLGHRFLGKKVTITDPNDYEKQLKQEFVIACPAERQTMIKEQINQLIQKNNWSVELDKKLLEEVTNLLEFPTVFVGRFAEKYLEVPEEVLVTSMKEHQRYFDVRNQQKSLLPYFISVRNGDDAHLENVIKGNEKVLLARLEDAEFFYNEDKKLSIAQCVEKLKQVTFHEKIGSIYQKMQRVQTIAQIIGKKINLTANELKELQRVSEIYKFDLVTNMVGEFPELQGIMGEKYARLQGETPSVAQAIREHYLPISSEGMLPESNIGAVLAIADKLDSVAAFFAKEIIPNSSNDPYGLRRQAYGIIRIIEAKKWTFPLVQLQEEIAQAFSKDLDYYGIQLPTESEKVTEFIKDRIRQLLLTKDVRYDVIEAVLSSKQKDLTQLFLAAETLKQHVEDANFKPSVEALTRVINLAKKGHIFVDQEIKIDETLFENDSERILNQAVNELEKKFQNNSMTENYQELINLRPLIDDYFDQTMIMVDDEKQKINRLNELARIARLALLIASIDLLIVK